METNILDGIRVLEFSWVVTGPSTTRLLAMHGATVIKVESSTRPEISRMTRPYKAGMSLNRSGFFARHNNDKLSITLNLNTPKGLELIKRLIASVDIVVEAFTPGQMAKWGLSYEDLRKIKPDLIMVSLSMQGQTGPHSRHPGYGIELQSLAGLTHLMGWPDAEPQVPFAAYTDFVVPYFAAATLVCALERRRQTGEGLYIDLPQYECGLQFLAPLMLDYFANNHVAGRTGNRSIYTGGAPEGVYQCQGDDRWCVISINTDKEWETFCNVSGNPEWAKDPRFATFLDRHEHADELDALIAEWTISRTAEEVMSLLQLAGVDAGVVQNAIDLLKDPQLGHRQHFRRLPHTEVGEFIHELPAFKLSETPATLERSAPCLGEHNEFVYTKIIGLSDEEFIDLLTEGIFE